jgi:hypothetical protein
VSFHVSRSTSGKVAHWRPCTKGDSVDRTHRHVGRILAHSDADGGRLIAQSFWFRLRRIRGCDHARPRCCAISHEARELSLRRSRRSETSALRTHPCEDSNVL